MAEFNEAVVVSEVVVAKVVACPGCRRQLEYDTANSLAFSINNEFCGGKDRLFYIPNALPSGGYTQDQLDFIEQSLAVYGIDIFPLDYPLLN